MIIDDLPESLLLLEIFPKLRNPRDLIVCKSVSKRWNFLLASSSSSIHNNPRFALILNTNSQLTTNDICLESWKGFELNNYVDPQFDYPLRVLASYRDVLLCMKKSSRPVKRRYQNCQWRSRLQLYIVNPVTMQWTSLPEFNTRELSEAIPEFPIGLLGNGSKGTYYVVMLDVSNHSILNVRVYDSKLGYWNSDFIKHPRWSPVTIRMEPNEIPVGKDIETETEFDKMELSFLISYLEKLYNNTI